MWYSNIIKQIAPSALLVRKKGDFVLSKLDKSIKKINTALFPRHSAPFYLIIGLFILVIFGGESEYIDRFKQLTNQTDGFNIMTQFFIPGFSGLVGGYSTVIMASLKDKYIQHNHVFSKFMSIGFIAGIAAVNLLNPSGTVSQVMILGLLAGLSGFSYLERSALVQTDTENETLVNSEDKDKAYETFEQYKSKDKYMGDVSDMNGASANVRNQRDRLREELKRLQDKKEGGKDGK